MTHVRTLSSWAEPDLAGLLVLPLLVLDDAVDADPVADALVGGGLPIAEVTFRTPAALEAIRRMAARGDLVVGAGTVTDAAQVDAAVDAGATFLVSPGLSPAVVARARERGVAILPGVATASEVMAALALGIETVKLFPAEVVGGVAAVRALAGPFPQLRMIPTGGVSAANAATYLAEAAVVAVGGSWMVPRDLVRRRDFEAISELVSAAAALGGARPAGGAA